MYLKSLELSGFKSFAKKTTLQFNTPITAIVGPNGSGKSNIAEAFRFALGEQSIKSMRGKRTEDLIWNGSPDLARMNRASVKLLFDNRKRLLNLDFDEAILERVIYRDASSEYLLNGSQVRLRDIVEVLAGAHIGASGHHIISQGEADRILNASLKERREMIEDALGLKIYQWKREESQHKLEKTEENMKQVESLRREIAPHLLFLKKQVEKVEKTKQLKEDLKTFYREYLKREHSFISFSRGRLAEEEQGPVHELDLLEKRLVSARRVLEETHGKDAKSADIIAVGEKLTRLRKDRDEFSREIGRIEGEIAAVERLQKLTLPENKEGAVIPYADIERVVHEAEQSLRGTEPDLSLWKQTCTQIVGKLKTLLARYQKKTSSSAEKMEEETALLLEKKKRAEEKLHGIRLAEHEALAEEQKLRTEIEKEKDSSRDAEKEVLKIMARQNELHGILGSVRVRMNEVEHAEQDFKRELAESAILVGRDTLAYDTFEVKDEQGRTLSMEEIASEDRAKQEERQRRIEKLKIRIEDAGAGGGAEVIKEFEEASERDAFLERELGDLKASAEKLHDLIRELEEKIEVEFKAGIEKINEAFARFFVLMFGGGTAKLGVAKRERSPRREIDDALLGEGEGLEGDVPEAAETGIDIDVSLPRKKIKGLMMLSGGERALTSIALLFAMSQVKPPPFIILDETDAALDEANSKKYGDMIENLSKYSQLILITHNRETMSRAGIIYGITMDKSGVSKLLSIAFDEAVQVAK